MADIVSTNTLSTGTTQELSIFTDGGARGNPGPAGIGVHVLDQAKKTVYELGVTIGNTTNNEAEYQAFLSSIQWLTTQTDFKNVQRVHWYLDSMLVVEQLNGRWKVKQPHLKPTVQQIRDLLAALPYPYQITHVPRELNYRADDLVNQALDAAG